VEKNYKNNVNDEIYEKLLKLTKELNLTIMNLSLLYFRYHSFSSVPIASFSNEQQLKDGMACCEIDINKDVIEELHKLKNYK